MCRFVVYLGPPVTLSSLLIEPTNSLIHQSFQSYESEDPLNGDGFGIGWYAREMSEHPAVFRSMSPAWSNRNLLELSRVTRSDCVLAHVRAATQDIPVSEANCHPFTFGPFAFMHNGDLGGFRRVRRKLLAHLSDQSFDMIGGATDSEHLFAMFLDRIEAKSGDRATEALAGALISTIRDAIQLTRREAVADHSYLNIAVCDGRRAAVSRFTTGEPEHALSLYLDRGRRYTCEDGVCRMVERRDGSGAVIVSSERLSDDPGWQVVPVNHLVSIDEGRNVQIRPIEV
jgi:glutamine amidotransferase